MLSHSTIRKLFHKACRDINAPKEKSCYRTQPIDFGYIYIKINDNGYHYIGTERGSETIHKTTTNADELIYWLISDVISDMASSYELTNRVNGQDCRRISFAKRLELFGKLKEEWAKRAGDEIDAILTKYPYNDRG